MNRIYRNIKQCRICGSKELDEVMKIGDQFLSPTFVKSNENNELSKIKVPLTLVLCNINENPNGCGLLQLRQTINPDVLYKNYFYRSSVNDTMRENLKDVVYDVTGRVKLMQGDFVVDIGANDCTMLSYFPSNLNRIGVEPAKNIDWSNVDKSIVIVNDYFSKKNIEKATKGKKPKIITSCAVFYDIDDPNKFVSDVKEILDEKGVWCIQLSYLPLMLENMNFYEICNEHLEYYSLRTLQILMQKHDLTITDASTNPTNGGSLRVSITHSGKNANMSHNVEKLLMSEKKMNLHLPSTYKEYYKKIEELGRSLVKYINSEINNGGFVIGLGASTKGNMLMQLFSIDKKMLPYISERNPEKVGLRTLGTDIELISEEAARKLNPSCMLVLPWSFKNEIIKRESDYIKNGGKLLFPMPYPHLVTNKGEIRL